MSTRETVVSDEYQVTEKLGETTYVPVSSGHFDVAEPDSLERALNYAATFRNLAMNHLGPDHRLRYVVRRVTVTEITETA
jgi:hypothetical protein